MIYNNHYYRQYKNRNENKKSIEFDIPLLVSIRQRIYNNTKYMKQFETITNSKTTTTTTTTTKKKHYEPLPKDLFNQFHSQSSEPIESSEYIQYPIQLNIGGIEPMEHWYNVNAQVDTLFGDLDTNRIIFREMYDLYVS